MRQLLLFFLLITLTGCTYGGEKKFSEYIQQPKYLIKDPHFTSYKGKRDALERQYLQKKISYADYQMQLKELDNDYSRDVQRRDEIISSY